MFMCEPSCRNRVTEKISVHFVNVNYTLERFVQHSLAQMTLIGMSFVPSLGAIKLNEIPNL